jgi:hypothetical protein
MAPPFTAKRVVVPGLLSDQGLAEGISALKGQSQQSVDNVAATRGVDVSRQILDLDVQMPAPRLPSGGHSLGSTISLSGSPAPTPQPPTQTGFGMLTPEQGEAEKQERILQAEVDAQAAQEDIVDKTRMLTDEQRAAIGLPPISAEERAAIQGAAVERREGYAQEAQERADFIKQAPAPTMTWWLDAAQVGARAAAQTGTSALKYPFSAFETLTYLGTGIETGKMAPRGWLDEVDAGLNKLLPGDPSRAKDFISELSAGAGSFVPFLIAGYLGSAVGLPAGVTAGGLGAAATGNQLYEEAESFNAPMMQKALALLMGTGLGATEAIPIDRMFMRADVGTGGLLRRMLANTQASTIEEFTQEFSQAIGEDMIAKYGAGYDPDRALDAMSWLRQGAIGGIVGGVAGGVTTLIPGATPGVDPAAQTAAVEEVFASEQARFDTIVGADPEADAGGTGEAAADASVPEVGVEAAAPVAQPTTNDLVQQIVGAVRPQAAVQTVETAGAAETVAAPETVLLDPAEPMSAVEVAPAVETPEFKAWFGNSAVRERAVSSRDKSPKGPLKVYHGTQAEFTEFAKTNQGTTTFMGIPVSVFRRGNFFAEDRSFAEGFANQGGKKGRVIEAYLSIQNPLEIADGTANNEDTQKLIEAGLDENWVRNWLGDPKTTWEAFESADDPESASFFVDALIAAGFDGVHMTEIDPDEQTGDGLRDVWVAFEPTQIKSATGNSGVFDPTNPDIYAQVANPLRPTAQTIAAVQLDTADTLPLPAIEKGLTGPIPIVVQAAKAYANAVGLPHRRQREYVRVDTGRAARIAQAYADMKHEPNNPAVQAAYRAMVDETIAQYQFVKATGLKIETLQPGQPDPYPNGSRDVLKDINAGHIWYFPTDQGFGSSEFDPTGNPLLDATGEVSDNGAPMVVNDLFRVVHDFFGHGLEGAGFGARGEENAWQAHMRLFSEAAVPAMTSETRGQNSWVNYGPYGEQNRADPRNTTYADQKTGLMPSWTWREGVADSQAAAWAAPVETDAATFRSALMAAKEASKFGAAVYVYEEAEYGKMKTFLSSDGLAGFALKGDDIVSVFSRGGGRLRSIIDTAIANGGRTLDAFDTGTADRPGLPQMYAALGFVETGRVSFDPSQSPPDWPAELGTPDVVFMEFAQPDVEAQSAVPLRRGSETLEPFGLTGARSNTRQIAAALELRQRAQAGQIARNDRSPAAIDKIANWMKEEVLFEMEAPGNSGVGWYSDKFQRALDKFAVVFPELEKDVDARNVLTLLIAVTSDGQKVIPNFAQAADIYSNYRSGKGLTTSRGTARQASVDSNLAHITSLLAELSPRELSEYLLSEFTVSELKREAAAKGVEFATKYQANVKLPRAAVELGPKLGAFYANLMGAQGYLTMDRWWSRTFNRYRGDLLDAPTTAGIARLRSLLGKPELTDDEVIAATVPFRQSYEAKGFKDGTELEKAANTIYKAAFEGLNDTPFSATDRTFMIDTVNRAKALLGEAGVEISVADIQAVLWYYEKRLYGELGARQSQDVSYEEAAQIVIDNRVGGAERSDVEIGEGATAYGSRDQGASQAIIEAMTGTSSVRQPFTAEPTRPAKGVPLQPDTQPDDVKLTQIAANFKKLLGLTVRQGRLVGGKNVFGEYNRKTASIRLRVWSDLSTLVHEGGHAINDAMAAPLNDFVTRNEAEVMRLGVAYYAGDLSNAPAATRRREGFAEFFRIYALTPDFARNKFPALTADFEATVKREDPAILDGLNAIAEQFKAWLQLPSARLIRSMVVDGRREQGINAAIKELKDLGFKSWMEEHTRRSVEWSVNRFAPLNRLVTELLNQAEANTGDALDLKRAEDPRTLVRLARNAGSRAMVEVTDGVYGYRSTQPMSRGLRDAIMLSQGVDPSTTPGSLDEERLKDFSAYIVARRAQDEYRRFEAGLIDRPPIGASLGDVRRAIKDYEAQYGQSFTDAAAIVHEYGMALWQKQYDAGLMSKETYLDGLERQFYAPLQRDMSDKKANFNASALTAGSRSLVRQFRGSDRDIVDPLAVLMQKTFALEQLINENDVVKNLAILADRAGRAGALVERIPASQVMGMTMSVEEAARQLSKDDTLSPADAQDLMTLLGASIKEGHTIQLFRRDQVSTKGENILFFWENGKPAAIQLKDGELGADVVNTLQGVGRENMPLFTELVAGTSTLFRTAITSWPDFLVVNYIRDQMSAWILNDVGFVPFASGIRGMVDEVRQKQWAKSYNAAQGIMGGMNVAALHEAKVDQDIRSLRSKGYIAQAFRDKTPILGAIRGFAEAAALSETGTRLGLYRGAFERAKGDGLNDYEASVEAAYTATDYMDFGLNGSRMTLARRTIPFLNAQLQGLYKLMRTLGADEVAQRKGLKFVLGAYMKGTKNLPLSRAEANAINTGRKAWVKMASLGLISALLHFIFRDDPDYQEAGEYLRTTGWVIPMGDGRVFYIPKPFELALMANAVERGLEYASGDSTAPGRFMRGAAMSLVPPTSPTSIQIAVELTANRDFFTGRDIVPTYMQALDPQLQYDNYTSSVAKWMGSTFNWSPMVVDHVLSGLGASAYRDISSAINAADPTRPSLDETDAPLLRRFIRDVRRGSASAQDFWAQASQTTGRLERASQTYKRFVEYGNDIAANQYLASLTADEKAYALLMTHFEADQKRLNPFYRARQVSTLISGMRREMASELGLGDTTIKDLPETFQMSASQKQQVDEILSEIARREVRNTLIATGQAGWENKEILPIEPTLDLLLTVSPDTYDEYQRRYKQRKIYDATSVYEYWPEVRDRLNFDGEFAVLSDVQAVAGVVF